MQLAMPLPALTDAEVEAAVKDLKSDLAYLFEQKEVPRNVQAAISRLRAGTSTSVS